MSKFGIFILSIIMFGQSSSLGAPNDLIQVTTTLSVTPAQIKELKDRLPKFQADTNFYHWADPVRIIRWIKQGYVDEGEMEHLNTPTGNLQASGAGLYVSGDPTNSSRFGPLSVTVPIKAGTPIYDANVIREVLGRNLAEVEQTSLGKFVGYGRNVSRSDNWWTFHSAENTKRIISSAVWGTRGDRLMPKVLQSHMLIELSKENPGAFGYAHSFANLARYQDGLSFIRSVIVNPRNPWSEFEPDKFDLFQNARDRMVEQIYDSWHLQTYEEARKNGSSEPTFERTNESPLGIARGEQFGNQVDDQATWTSKQIALIKHFRQQTSGEVNNEWREGFVRGGGDSVNRTFIATAKQLDVLTRNEYLDVKSQFNSVTGLYNVKYDYPHVRSWKKYAEKLPAELVGKLAQVDFNALSPNDPLVKSLNQHFLDGLITYVFNRYYKKPVSMSNDLLRDLISIHPWSDYNGRSLRLYQEAAHLESNTDAPYHFISDFDLLVKPETYDRMTKGGNTAIQNFEAKLLAEAVQARNEHRAPEFHRLKFGEQNFVTNFGPAFESIGLPADIDLTPKRLDLIRTRKWSELYMDLGRRSFELQTPSDWVDEIQSFVDHPDLYKNNPAALRSLLMDLKVYVSSFSKNLNGRNAEHLLSVFIVLDQVESPSAKLASRKFTIAMLADPGIDAYTLADIVRSLEKKGFFAGEETSGDAIKVAAQKFPELLNWSKVPGGSKRLAEELGKIPGPERLTAEKKVLSSRLLRSGDENLTAYFVMRGDQVERDGDLKTLRIVFEALLESRKIPDPVFQKWIRALAKNDLDFLITITKSGYTAYSASQQTIVEGLAANQIVAIHHEVEKHVNLVKGGRAGLTPELLRKVEKAVELAQYFKLKNNKVGKSLRFFQNAGLSDQAGRYLSENEMGTISQRTKLLLDELAKVKRQSPNDTMRIEPIIKNLIALDPNSKVALDFVIDYAKSGSFDSTYLTELLGKVKIDLSFLPAIFANFQNKMRNRYIDRASLIIMLELAQTNDYWDSNVEKLFLEGMLPEKSTFIPWAIHHANEPAVFARILNQFLYSRDIEAKIVTELESRLKNGKMRPDVISATLTKFQYVSDLSGKLLAKVGIGDPNARALFLRKAYSFSTPYSYIALLNSAGVDELETHSILNAIRSDRVGNVIAKWSDADPKSMAVKLSSIFEKHPDILERAILGSFAREFSTPEKAAEFLSALTSSEVKLKILASTNLDWSSSDPHSAEDIQTERSRREAFRARFPGLRKKIEDGIPKKDLVPKSNHSAPMDRLREVYDGLHKDKTFIDCLKIFF